MSADTANEEAVEPETQSQVLTDIQERGRKRLAVATNAAAWAIYGNDDEEQITIDPKDVAMAEIVAIRVLTQLKEAGLIDNEPLLGLATTGELLEELESRGRIGLDGTGGGEGEENMATACALLINVLPDEVLNYSTAKKKPVAGDSTDNDGDDAEKENTE